MPETLSHRITAEQAGQTLAAVVRGLQPGIAWSRARQLCERGKVTVDGAVIIDSATRVREGMTIAIEPGAKRPVPAEHDVPILHADRDVVVVDKPAGVITVPFATPSEAQAAGEIDRDTLVHRVAMALRRREGRAAPPPRVVQRLDKPTSGVMVFARNKQAERTLQQQLRRHDVDRAYVALAYGDVVSGTVESHLLQDRGDGLRGSWRPRWANEAPPGDSKRAVTIIEALERFDIACATPLRVSLVRCRLQTGRQHQIRIHLAERGHPLIGEKVYDRDYRALGGLKIDGDAGRLRPMLHAQRLGFVHPRSGRELVFESPVPADFEALLADLRAGRVRCASGGERSFSPAGA